MTVKILRLLNFNVVFQLVLTKFFKSELFSCLPKVSHVIKSCRVYSECKPLFHRIWGIDLSDVKLYVSFLKPQTFLSLFPRSKAI